MRSSVSCVARTAPWPARAWSEWACVISALPAGRVRRGSCTGKLMSAGRVIRREGGLHTLYIAPLKALAVDTQRNLAPPVAEMGLPIRLESRTGDTPASKRQRQRRDPPQILLT